MSNPNRRFHDEPRAAIVKRRLVTVPRSIASAAITTLLLPLLLVGAVIVDVARWLVRRRPFVAVRLVGFGWVYAVVEVAGLVWMLAVWVGTGLGTRRQRLVDATWPIQAWWASTLFGAARRIFGLTLDVTGLEAARPGPIVAMFRHASIVDNLLPAALLQARLGYRLRWLLKRELLSVTALDVAGTRLPNHFVDRQSADPRRELRAIKQLSADLAPDEGVLIYPEGTRFTPERQRRELARLADRSPELVALAETLHHTMPPRLGGTLTLLDNGYDVVVCVHEGLAGFARISDIWSGDLVGRTITVEFWRIPADDIPTSRNGRVQWLFDLWQQVDDWVGATRRAAV